MSRGQAEITGDRKVLEQISSAGVDPMSLMMVVFIDLVLSGDNAIVIGLAAAALPATMRRTAIIWGIGIAIALRVLFAISALQLMQVTGLKLFGGLLLLWVCFRLWRDLMDEAAAESEFGQVQPFSATATVDAESIFWSAMFLRAMTSIIVADVSMSLDNVLAVAGVAKDNMITLVVGLALSIAMMAIAATAIARTLESYRWIAYVGLAIILWVAGEMIWHGVAEVNQQLL